MPGFIQGQAGVGQRVLRFGHRHRRFRLSDLRLQRRRVEPHHHLPGLHGAAPVYQEFDAATASFSSTLAR